MTISVLLSLQHTEVVLYFRRRVPNVTYVDPKIGQSDKSRDLVFYWRAGREAEAAKNACEMEVCEASSLTAVANKSLDMSRSLTEKIAAADASDTDDENDDDDGGDGDNPILTSVSHDSSDKQVVQLWGGCNLWNTAIKSVA